VNIAPLGLDELPEAAALLEANGLPTGDLSSAVRLLGVRDARGLEGVVGLEARGEAGLLRSLAVRSDQRETGLGSALVLEVERMAAAAGIAELYLLTTTAERFFSHRGYHRAEREDAPAPIRTTSEFASVCPSSAVFMRKVLSRPVGAPR